MLAEHYHGRGVEHEELVQEGSLGLMHAIEKFDPARPVNFMTYAAHWIRQAMGRCCERQGTLNRYGTRLPAHVISAMSRITRVAPEFEAELGRQPTDEELAARCEVSVDAVQMAQRMLSHSISSIDAADMLDEDLPALQVPDEAADVVDLIEADQQRSAVKEMVARLPADQRKVIERRFGFGADGPSTERELADEWDVSRGQLQALRNSALQTLRSDPLSAALDRDRMSAAVLRHVPLDTCCGHLGDVELASVPAEVFTMTEKAAYGRHGSFWWMISDDGHGMKLHVTDGPDGELFSVGDAVRCFEGEQAEEFMQFAQRFSLQQADACAHCR
jgi:RNA polymerase primary sigma factor